jgi:DNA (cytosine-5)-methyltransferase 1
MADVITKKWDRLQEGRAPRVLDLFSGAGGFSLGFQQAGCEIIAGVELDEDAAATHHLNFAHAHGVHPGPVDITKTSATALMSQLSPGVAPDELVDLLIGGPPCTAFTRVGRAKLESVRKGDPDTGTPAFLVDPRAQLYQQYLEYVECLKPVGLVMENVPDLLNFGGANVAEDVCERLDELGYCARYTILNAAAYDVPQLRSRLILIAWHRSTGLAPSFPAPSRAVELPRGYLSAQQVALKPHNDKIRIASGWVEPPTADGLPPAVTVSEAIGDLPPIVAHLTGQLRKGRRDLRAAAIGVRPEPTAWAKAHVAAKSGPVTAHVIRSLSWRDYRLFRCMDADEEYPAVWRRAHELYAGWQSALLSRQGQICDATPAGRALQREALGLAEVLRRAGDALPADLDARFTAMDTVVAAAAEVQKGLREALPSNAPLGWPGRSDLPAPVDAAWAALRRSLSLVQQGLVPARLLADAAATVREVQRALNASSVWRVGAQEMGLPGGSPAADLLLAPVPADLQADGALDPLPEDALPAAQVALALRALRAGLLGLTLAASDGHATVAHFIPPYNPVGFPNKWRKMNPAAPARTLMAHLGKDSYSHIHPSGEQARTLSVREAARLQSFPDSFQFCGSMNAGFRQIGNAVPPMLARAIAKSLRAQVAAAAAAEGLAAR